MYNGQAIRKLITKAGLTNKEFQKLMFNGKSTDLYHVENTKSVTSKTLERMRDILKCSMDDFFTTPEWMTDENGNLKGHQEDSDTTSSSRKIESYMKDLIEEKNKRIEVLENYVKLLEKQIK